MVISTIKLAESSAIGLSLATQKLGDAAIARNPLCLSQSTVETISSLSYLVYYAAWIPNKLETLKITHIPLPIEKVFAIAGIVAGTFKFGMEALSFVIQRLFLKIFEIHAWTPQKIERTLADVISQQNSADPRIQACFEKAAPQKFRNLISQLDLPRLLEAVRAGDQGALEDARYILFQWTGREIRDELEEIKNLDMITLQSALPDWLFETVKCRGGKEYLNALFERVDRADPVATAEAKKLLTAMKSYARKKMFLHVIGMIGAVIGVISCIGLMVAFPLPAAIIILLLVGVCATAAYVYRKSYVENPAEDISLKLCLPEFMRPKEKPLIAQVVTPAKLSSKRVSLHSPRTRHLPTLAKTARTA